MSSITRAMKRREIKEQKKTQKKISEVAKKIEDMYEKGYHDGMNEEIEITMYMMAYTINYKLGFGKKRLLEIIRAVYNNIDSFRSGHLDKVDYEEIKSQMRALGITWGNILEGTNGDIKRG